MCDGILIIQQWEPALCGAEFLGGEDGPRSLTGHPAYGIVQLRGDLERFAFLLGGSHGEGLFGARVGE